MARPRALSPLTCNRAMGGLAAMGFLYRMGVATAFIVGYGEAFYKGGPFRALALTDNDSCLSFIPMTKRRKRSAHL